MLPHQSLAGLLSSVPSHHSHAKGSLLPALLFAAGPSERVPPTHPGPGLEASLPFLFFLHRHNPKFLPAHPSPPAPPQPSPHRGDGGSETPQSVYPWRNTAVCMPQPRSGTPTRTQPGARWAPTLTPAGTGGGKTVVPGQVAAAGRSLPPQQAPAERRGWEEASQKTES